MSGKTYALLAALLLASFAVPFAPSVTYVDHAWMVMLTCSALLSAGFLFFLLRQRSTTEKLQVEINAKATHFVQAIAQSSIYFYVALFYDGPARWAIFIIYQLIFAYVFDFLVSAFRHNRYKLGFNVFPIVLSINLFMWFKPDFFAGQIAMLIFAILAKSYIVRRIDGRPSHIFNPSALPMALTAILIVIVLNAEFMLSTNNIVASYLVPPHMQLFVFAVGLLSHLAAGISFVSMGAVVTLVAFDALFRAATGLPPMGDIVHPSVFIGITLLVTDPVTSPKTRHGQFIYGCLYGLGIIAAYTLLQRSGFPTYYDKILPVPLLNFAAPYIDRIRVPVFGLFKNPIWQRKWVPSAVYAVVFVSLVPMIERNFMRRTYFIQNRAEALSASGSQAKASGRGDPLLKHRPERRQPIDPALGALIQKRIVEACEADPGAGACWLLRQRPS